MGLLQNLFGQGPKTDYKELMRQGAIILDVRSKGEYASGNIPGSTNIPLPELANYLKKIPKTNTPVITCCASGMRSESARKMLLNHGYTNVYNGGGWNSLLRLLNKND